MAGRGDVRVDDLPRTAIDVVEPAHFRGAERFGGTIKPVALASLDGDDVEAWVGPAFVSRHHPLAALDGVANAVRFTSAAGETLTFSGPGAGPRATAVTILDDVIEAVSGREGVTGAHGIGARHRALGAQHRPRFPEWFISLDSDGQFSACDVVSILTSRQIPPTRVLTVAGRTHVRTGPVSRAVVSEAAAALRRAGVNVLAVPVLEEKTSGVFLHKT